MASDFSERLLEWDWDDLTLRINSKTARDVEQALNSPKLTREDFMALISPAAAPIWSPWRNEHSSSPASVSVTW